MSLPDSLYLSVSAAIDCPLFFLIVDVVRHSLPVQVRAITAENAIGPISPTALERDHARSWR